MRLATLKQSLTTKNAAQSDSDEDVRAHNRTQQSPRQDRQTTPGGGILVRDESAQNKPNPILQNLFMPPAERQKSMAGFFAKLFEHKDKHEEETKNKKNLLFSNLVAGLQ